MYVTGSEKRAHFVHQLNWN